MFLLASLKMSQGVGNITSPSFVLSNPSLILSIPLFNFHSSALPPSTRPTFPHSAYQKRIREIKGTSDSLHPLHLSSIIHKCFPTLPTITETPLPHLLVHVLPPFPSPPAFLSLLWARAWLRISSSLAKDTSFQKEMNRFHLCFCLALFQLPVRLNRDWQ